MKYDGGMDKECIAICDAINQIPGLQTVESCCGHGDKEFRVWFGVQDLENLPVLLYCCGHCHVGFRWNCLVDTDCRVSPVTFCLESESMGEAAYREAQEIADEITSFLSENAV